MDATNLLSRLLRTPAALRTTLLPPTRPQTRSFAALAHSQPQARFLSIPRIVTPSFWGSMIPKPLRKSTEQPSSRKEWNPATPYIILGLLIGSQAIQTLWLKQERRHSLRKAEAKIGVLREVIERVQRGEDVRVEEVLGTGDGVSEGEWAEVLKDIQGEEALFQSKKKRKALREEAAVEEQEELKGEEKSGQNHQAKVQVESFKGTKFY
ncbi:hypothetical protein IQ07DRAFT_638434 [Pyrenochaeta sp. DS3sAY3a]|nr:hypothetical protein IQ07DRAFT_638434 [Pyrenochaeta sp. DS3sAY3a]